MQIRRLTKEDRYEAGLISTIAFHMRHDDLAKKREEWEKSTDEDWGAFTEDGKMAARIINNRYTAYLNGHCVQNGGIGAVSTLPEYRNDGAIRQIFGELLPYAYRNGEVISTLYPFNHSFYRKFGYETVCHRQEYKFKPEALKNFRFEGEVHMWSEGESVTPYTELYERWARNISLCIMRDDRMMAECHIKGNIYKDRCFTYMLSAHGRNIAYVILKDVYHDPAAIMEVEDLAWDGREGFRAILGFLARFSADYGTIVLPMPTDIELLSLLDTPYDTENTKHSSYMARIINVSEALKCLTLKDGQSFSVCVHDEFIEENNGCFNVCAKDGRTDVCRADASDAPADIVTDIRALSQLTVGAVSLKEAMLRPDVQVNSRADVLSEVFVRRGIFVSDHF